MGEGAVMSGFARYCGKLGSVLALLTGGAAAFADVGDTVHVESHQANFIVETLAEDLEFPWALAFLPNGEMLISERGGKLMRRSADGALTDIAHDLPVTVINQGGLFDISPHPEFEENQLIYAAFATGSQQSPRTALARFELNDDKAENVEIIFRADMKTKRGRHFGGRIVWAGPDTLFLTLGDGGGYMKQSQNTGNHWGAIVRLTADGAAHPGNPFEETDGAKPEIWSYGHRNVQGAALHPDSGELWTHEHGARGGDELNIARPGRNYGWPAVTYGIDYSGDIISELTQADGYEEPLWYWRPSIAPSGLAIYDGEAFPEWRGDVFVGALAGAKLERLEIDGERVIGVEPLLIEEYERIRDVRVGPNGFVYLLTDSGSARLLRLTPQ